MARGRLISRTLGSSRKFAALRQHAGKLGEFAQVLYPMLIACSDDFGRMAGDAFTVRLTVFPSSPRSDEEFASALAAMHAVDLIHIYEVEGDQVLEIVDFEQYQPGLSKRTRSKFPGPPVKFTEIPSEEKRREEKGIEENRTEENRTEGKAATAASPLSEIPSDVDPSMPECKVEAVVQLWNEMVVGSPLSQCRGLSDARRKHIRARLKEHGLGRIRDAIAKALASKFCTGHNDRGWKASFDWLMERQDAIFRVLEGKYDDRAGPPIATGTDGKGRTGRPEVGKYQGIEERDD